MSRLLGLDGEDRVIVVGGGIAGLATALSLAPAPVTLVTRAGLGTEASTCWAQGGTAAAFGPDDTPGLHADDTAAAGAGLPKRRSPGASADDAAACVEALIGWGVRFDRDTGGKLALGLSSGPQPATHCPCRRRRLRGCNPHQLARSTTVAPSIEVMEGVTIVDLVLDDDGAVAGVLGTSGGQRFWLPARAVVLATGGIGGLYGSTTNPLGAVGSGLALCARAGAVLSDLEFVQFHPTAMALGQDRRRSRPKPSAAKAPYSSTAGATLHGRRARRGAGVTGCGRARHLGPDRGGTMRFPRRARRSARASPSAFRP